MSVELWRGGGGVGWGAGEEGAEFNGGWGRARRGMQPEAAGFVFLFIFFVCRFSYFTVTR